LRKPEPASVVAVGVMRSQGNGAETDVLIG